MIHQLIFAKPKPGMSVKEFQDYWIHVHAVSYASKIEQIKKYKVNRILPMSDGAAPVFNGVAEIWLENEEEQLASLQSDAFIKGARADEPNWAAFWATFGLDTYSYDKLLCDEEPEYKLLFLMKRREGIPLELFREQLTEKIAGLFGDVEGIPQITVSIVKDSFYEVGESAFDAALHLWVNHVDELRRLTASEEFMKADAELMKLVNERYMHRFLCQENRIF